MKFALITADTKHHISFKTDPEQGDATSFMQWVSILDGVHLSFDSLRTESNDYLRDFDVVMMSGHLNYMADIIRIGKFLKESKTITIFYPEGSAQLYDNSINGFHPEYYEAWRACDVVSIAEDDKSDYYESFVDPKKTIVTWIHVPMTEDMERGAFFKLRGMKTNYSMVYGDNNPNHPMIAFSCINKLNGIISDDKKLLAVGVETRNAEINRIFPDLMVKQIGKMSAYDFMRNLSYSFLHFYPTEWIGTARQPIACAAVGTPCIGSNLSHTQRRLWPELSFSPYDVLGMTYCAEKLISDESFYNGVVQHALGVMKIYGKAATIHRFNLAVDWARAMKKNAEVPA